MQMLALILVYGVFIEAFIVLSYLMAMTLLRYLHEVDARRKQVRGMHSPDTAGLVAASPDAMLITNHLGVIVQSNQRAAALFGYDDLHGHSIEDLVPEALRGVHKEHRIHYFVAPRARRMGSDLDLHGRHADGTTFAAEIALSPLTINGERHAVAIIRARPTLPPL